jgi:hypothetical protein
MAASEGAEFDGRRALHPTMLRPRHGPAHNLTVDEFDPLLRAFKQIDQGSRFQGFHRMTSRMTVALRR